MMTSWSRNRNIAEGAALKHANAGVVMTIVVKKTELIISRPSLQFPFDEEEEVQLIGVRNALFTDKIGK
jgi:hypothetical protein